MKKPREMTDAELWDEKLQLDRQILAVTVELRKLNARFHHVQRERHDRKYKRKPNSISPAQQ